MLSYFARLNYNYANKYYLTASFRGDASSLFVLKTVGDISLLFLLPGHFLTKTSGKII